MSRSALILGGSGFLGSAIARELLRAGWKVAALGRGRTPNRNEGTETLVADRKKAGALAEAIKGRRFDLVVDCVAFIQSDAVDAVKTFAGLIGHCIVISTDYVYAPRPDMRFPIREDAPTWKDIPYVGGKVDCEEVFIQSWKEKQFPVTILRPPHLIGPGRALGCNSPQVGDPKLLDYIRSGKGLVLVHDGQHLIQPVAVREVGACIAHFAGNAKSFGQIMNCPGPDCVTTLGYYHTIADCLGVPLKYTTMTIEEFQARVPSSAPFLRHRIYDSSRLKEITGYVPRIPFRDAVREALDWLRDNSSAR